MMVNNSQEQIDAMTSSTLAPPRLERVADLVVHVSAPLDVGDTPAGRRRIVPITSGTLNGPLLHGQVLPGGADFQLLTSATQSFIQARYVLQTLEGERIFVENTGMRVAAPEVIEQINQDKPVDPALVYFRTTPRFETASPRLRWMMESVFVGTGARYPDRVELAFFRVT
jgi:hypothetical protein